MPGAFRAVEGHRGDALAQALGVPVREGFVKNRYIGRTFIMPGQSERVKSVRRKLNPIGLEFRNKNVLLVDDSIVRGTTSKQIIQMAREAGAKKVYLASAAPPVRYAWPHDRGNPADPRRGPAHLPGSRRSDLGRQGRQRESPAVRYVMFLRRIRDRR